MKKLLLFAQTLVSAGMIVAQTTSFTLTYNFAQVSSTTTPCTGTVDPTPPPTATGLTSGSFIAVGTNTCPSTSGYFSFSGWGTGATNGDDANFTGSLDPNKYYEITINPQTNYKLTFDSIIFKANRSGTGPRFWSVRSSDDGFTNNFPAAATNTNITITTNNEFFWTTDAYSSTVILSGFKVTPTLSNITSPISFRWYAWNAEGTAGTFRIDDVNIYGSATFVTNVATFSHNLNAHFTISPNPASGNVVYLVPQNIKEISFVEIINSLGSTIYKNTKIENSNKIALPIETIPEGVYFVRLGNSQNYYLEKLIINK
ncbi:MAG: hypothetical protein KatS3mg027_1098 [Bacteroidia bacterium]|nr:MAG: hypothetical protein KatS3mg027_1098 [Bacteroidia bacterium]